MHISWNDPLPEEKLYSQRKLLPQWCLHWTRAKVITVVLGLCTLLVFILFNVLMTNGSHIHTTLKNCKDCHMTPPTNKSLYRKQHIRYKHTARHLPQCIVIGARKAGTRALLEILNIHPLIMVAGHEQHFFDDDENYQMGYEFYRRQMPFAFPGQITIEKTPAYFHTEKVPKRVQKMNTSMKLLLVIRDPVERAISDYVQIRERKRSKNIEFGSFEDQVYDDDSGEIINSCPFLHRSMYYRHFLNWLKYFPLEQFHIVDGNKLVHDPQEEVTRMENFLGIAHRIDEDNLVYNKTKGFYCFRNESMNGKLNPVQCLSSTKGRKHPDVKPEVIRKLRQYCAPFNQKFYRLCGRTFNWPSS